MDFSIISRMADAGFLFAPASMGMTRSDRLGWQDIGTNARATLRQWVSDGDNLVAVAKHGHGFAVDADDTAALKAMGFDFGWLDGCYLVDTPGGGLHAHGLNDAETEALGNLVVVHAEKGNSKSKKVLELKLHNQSVAAPSAIRLHQWGKADGEYLPRGGFSGTRKGLPAAMLGWIREHAEEPRTACEGSRTAFKFHPDFDLEEFLENEGCTEKQAGWMDGSFAVEADSCPHCPAESRESTLRAGVTKFLFSGTGYGFICQACGVSTREEHERLMEEDDPEYKPWRSFIYRHDDLGLLLADGAKAGFEAEEYKPGAEANAEPGRLAMPEASSQSLACSPAPAPGRPDTSRYRYGLDDTGNGERLVAKFGEALRWIHETRTWMVWGEHGWRKDDRGKLMRMTKGVIDDILEESKKWWAVYCEASKEGNKEKMDDAEGKATALGQHASKSAKLERRKAMAESASFEKGIHSNLGEWDSDGWLLNVRNGVIDLRTQAFRERTQADMCMRQAPVAYDPRARCPLWEAAMTKWMCGDRELVGYLQAALGVTLTSDTSLQCFFFLEGGGENGKDTFLSTVQKAVLGDDGGYSRGVNIMTLMETKWGHSEHRNDLAALAGATRMVTAAETLEGHHWDEATIKDLTGGMTSVTCREIHGRPFSFVPQFKLWVMSNYAPVIKGTDWAIWRRVKRIPWDYDFSLHPGEKDPDFPARLRAEAAGILNWMLAGVRLYLENGKNLPECKAVAKATEHYRRDMDIVGRFVQESLELRPAATALQKTIYSAYRTWCGQNEELPVKARRFFADFRRRFPSLREQGSGGTTQFVGVGVRFDPDPPGPEDVE